ncbi:2-isopropylmalate synthase [Fuerstiella marisgermanici]|uniref:2-isopropylmalate synthase n=1 Tax=Fuerstiella marisgermanici TaxID=1891926 RepID=A0A1P8WIU8_9PLAN|nr:2-isopropylmalate synthase [Fuerstiella marisgermanici]APZ93992.1 2-isopropylmalate synthase [Fuerstiella marisgermanici]
MSSEQIIIFDTTLRDGEQSPGCSMNTKEKLEVARALVDLNVDVIEAGFPIASPGDFEAVQMIAERFSDRSTICALARSREDDIAKAKAALANAEKRRIHVFLATSAIHREHKLKMDKQQIIERAISSVADAKEFCDDVEFSPEDAARTELDFLCEVVEKTIAAGATTVNIPDTVGYATPNHYFKVISYLKDNVSNIDKAIISTHCHNDLGLAVANSLSAIEAGARQVECTINGLGERAGNAALEEVVMALRTRADFYNVHTNIKTERLFPTSQLVSSITGMKVQRNKAIVGRNAFAHEAGIHQHGVLQERTTYEIMRAEDVGYAGENLVLGKHSGRHAFRDRVKELGFELDDQTFQKTFDDFIALADKKKEIYDSDIIALIDNRMTDAPVRWKLISFHTSAGSAAVPTATLELQCEDQPVLCDAATGDGPIDAVFRALERIIEITARLEDFQVRSVSEGKDALGEVRVTINVLGRPYLGKGVSTDIIEAATAAYLQALNKADADRQAGVVSAAEKLTAKVP